MWKFRGHENCTSGERATQASREALPARAKIKRGGAPADYLAWLKDLPMPNPRGNSTNTDIDYMSRVPFRSIGR